MSTIYWSEVKGKKHLRSSRRGVDGEILLRPFIKGLDWIRLCRNRDYRLAVVNTAMKLWVT